MLINLNKKIKLREYKIQPSICFISKYPVKREIFAGDFSDRLVHHYIFSELSPIYEKLFIYDSYSCRKNKGTALGIKRVESFFKAVSNNYSKKAYVLRLDIQGYFMSINKNLLYKMNKDILKEKLKDDPAKLNLLLYLLRISIFNKAQANCEIRGPIQDWEGLVKNKSLFFAKDSCGLPIGNLSSQLFSNLYLNGLDHYIKRKLKCKYYGRYVDDMVFCHQSKEYLKDIISKIDNYLTKNLNLKLHPKKIYLQEISKSCDFLGANIKIGHTRPGKRIIKNFYKYLKLASEGKASQEQLNSMLGYLKTFKSYRLRVRILQSPLGQKALKRLNLKVNNDYTKLIPDCLNKNLKKSLPKL